MFSYKACDRVITHQFALLCNSQFQSAGLGVYWRAVLIIAMEMPEDPTEHLQEEIHHRAVLAH
jgi:hypothetical protein